MPRASVIESRGSSNTNIMGATSGRVLHVDIYIRYTNGSEIKVPEILEGNLPEIDIYPGINRKSRVSYPGTGFLSNAT